MRSCEHCGVAAEDLFCGQCGTLQQPEPEYFQFLGIPEKLQVDKQELQKRFYSLSRRLHPDLFTRKGDFEKQCSLEASSILNDAYRTLRDPVERAEYVLERHGFDIGEQRSSNVPPELLEEVFELNMSLEELRGGDESVRPRLQAADQRFHGMLTANDRRLAELFAEYDGGGGRDTLVKIRHELDRRRYIANLVREVEKELNKNVDVPD